MMLGLGMGTSFGPKGGADTLQRLYAIDADTFYIITPYSVTGGAIAHKFGKGATYGGTASSIGSPWNTWRHIGTFELASLTSNPASPIAAWSDDSGAQDYALQFGSTYGGSYHGGVTVSAQAITANGASVDPTVTQYGRSFAISHTATIDWGSGNTASVTYTLTIGADGALVETASLTCAISLTSHTLGMFIGSGAGFSEATFGANNYRVDLSAANVEAFLGTPSTITLRDPTTGRTVTSTTNSTSIATYRRSRIVRQDGTPRSKAYFQRAAGVPGTVSGVTRTTTFGKGATGASSFGSNVITNGAFASDISGWTTTHGAAAWNAGKLRQTRATGNENRSLQAMTCVIGETYAVYADVSSASVGGRILVGISSGGSTSGALVDEQIDTVGQVAAVFTATQTTHYVMLRQIAGTAGQTLDWDNVVAYKIS